MLKERIKEVNGVPLGIELECIQEHPDGTFIKGQNYRVGTYRMYGRCLGVRIRDSKRERKDFNFIPTSKNYLWKYFKQTDK